MSSRLHTLLLVILTVWSAGWVSAGTPAPPPSSTPGLRWNSSRQEISAEIPGWPLPKLLEHLGEATGWRIFYEPGTGLQVSTRFQNLPKGEALRRLLGELNFALLPQTNSPPRLLVYVRNRDAAYREVTRRPASERDRVENELIVTLRPGSKQSIEEIARLLGARVVGRIEGLNAFRLQFDDAAAATEAHRRLQDDPQIAAVDSNFYLDRPDRIPQPGSSSATSFNLRPQYSPNGEYPVIALIDTAVAAEGSPVKEFLLPTLSIAGESPPSPQGPTHGTAMAETILAALAQSNGGETTSWRILPVDVYGSNPRTTTYQVAQGILAAAAASGPLLFNLSLGSEAESPFLHRVIQDLQSRGAGFVAAAGNQPVPSPTYPAAYPEVLAVTAGDGRGGLAPYANYGSFIDVVAPGSQIIHYQGAAYLGNGTSYSASKVSGLVAGYLARHPGSTFNQAVAELSRQLPPVSPPPGTPVGR